MNQNLRNETQQEEPEKAESETPRSPIVSQLHSLQAIHLEFNLALEVHLMESLHWNLILSRILLGIFRFFKLEVVLYPFTRESGLLIDTSSDTGERVPETNEDWDRGDGEEEQVGEESTTDLVF